MKFYKLLSLTIILTIQCGLMAKGNYPFAYVYPKPGSNMVSNKTSIIIRSKNQIDQTLLALKMIKVEGSISGNHYGELILADDNKTIIFSPNFDFASGEEVKVEVSKGLKINSNGDLGEFSFNFYTAPEGIKQLILSLDGEILDENQLPKTLREVGNAIMLPPPPITIDSVENPSPGYIFLATWDRNIPALYGNFIFILDNGGNIVDSIRVNGAPFDFQVQQNGLLSYALGNYAINVPGPGEELQHMVLDNNLAVVDSFKMKNGFLTDFHEFKMMPNGHVMMMSYHTIITDMSQIVQGGQTDAKLVINIIQEQDINKNVVFEWRNIDHIPITDSDLDLTASRINYSTLNAFDIDTDGNILASFRNHSEIMKISRKTGEILWRMGSSRGDFTFEGEHEENSPYFHARQHNIQRQPNGNITLFDNGEFHEPPYSRAVEYSLDEVNKIATLASEWRYPHGNIFCVTAGNAQALPNGGWFIGFGVPNPQFVKRNAVEVNPDGSIALELSLPSKVLAYRVQKFPWKELVSTPSYTHFEVIEGSTYSFNDEKNITGVDIHYSSLTDYYYYNEVTVTKQPYGPVKPIFQNDTTSVSPVSIIYSGASILSQTAEFTIDMLVYPEVLNPSETIIYYRNIFNDEEVFQPILTSYNFDDSTLTATIEGFGELIFGVPGVILGINDNESQLPNEFMLEQNFPNPFNPETTINYTLPEASNVKVSIFNIMGEEIALLINENQEAGYRSVRWNGTDISGRKVSGGMYLYRIQAGSFTKTRKMVLLK